MLTPWLSCVPRQLADSQPQNVERYWQLLHRLLTRRWLTSSPNCISFCRQPSSLWCLPSFQLS